MAPFNDQGAAVEGVFDIDIETCNECGEGLDHSMHRGYGGDSEDYRSAQEQGQYH